MDSVRSRTTTERPEPTRRQPAPSPPPHPETPDRVAVASEPEDDARSSEGFGNFLGALKGNLGPGPLDVIGGLFGGGDDETAEEVAAPQSRVLQPSGGEAPPRELSRDGDLRVTSFNVHHMEGPGDAGDPGQTDQIVGSLRDRAPSDVYLLQEMPPDQAQEVADRMGMRGYYSRTTESQGNMILVHPDLKVEGNERAVLNGDFEPGDVEGAREALDYHDDADDDVEGQFREPRAVQALRVRAPGGESAVLWNTHLTAGLEDNEGESSGETLGERRATEAAALNGFIDDFKRPGEAVIGGGDLNSRPGESVAPVLRQGGHRLTGDEAQEQLDYVAVQGLKEKAQVLLNERLYDGDTQISDHPILSTLVSLR